MHLSHKELENLKAHGAVLARLSIASTNKRKEMLKNSSIPLIEALSTSIRLLENEGYGFDDYHKRRARRMTSRNVSKRNKLIMVQGKPGHPSRGEKFFKDDLEKTIQPNNKGYIL